MPDAGYDVSSSSESDIGEVEGATITFEGNGITGAVIIGSGISIPGLDDEDGGDGDKTSLTIGYSNTVDSDN